MYIIKYLGQGWYSFAKIPQGNNYVRIDAVKCESDKKALNQAKKIVRNGELPPIKSQKDAVIMK